MSGSGPVSRVAQLVALAEILFVLAAGNIAGALIYGAIVPPSVSAGEASGVVEGLYGGLAILLRIGLIAAFGLALIRYRRGTTLREVGLTRAGKPLGHLIGIGVLLGAFSCLLIGLVFAVHALVPFGEGLAAWDDLRIAPRNAAFYVDLLATSIIIPPLVEEIMARGYMRVRLVESYGVMGGVVLTGLIFALAHGKFISTDPLLAVFMVTLVINSVSWAWITQNTGSLIPAMVGHALTNGIATLYLFNVWVPLAAVCALILWQRQPVIAALCHFADEWRADSQKTSLWLGVFVLVAVIAILTIAMSTIGRMNALILVGALCLVITIANVVMEKRTRAG